ncbi:MAG: hypothetical protein WA691_05590, partial [Thermoplasmata archaeon]
GTVGRGGLAAARLAAGGPGARRALVEMLDVRPRVREGVALAPLAHAMIDTSDGVGDASRLMAEASRARLVVEEELLPLARGTPLAARNTRERRAIAFYGGDYELLAAVPRNRWALAQRLVRRSGGRLTLVGRVERGRGAWLQVRGKDSPMPEAGWQPFGALVSSTR